MLPLRLAAGVLSSLRLALTVGIRISLWLLGLVVSMATFSASPCASSVARFSCSLPLALARISPSSSLLLMAVALNCGYSDQSAFTRQFRRTIGMSPGEYRRIHRTGGE